MEQDDVTPTGRRRIGVVGSNFDMARAIGNLIHEDFNRLEDRVLAQLVPDEKMQRQLEKTILFGTRYTQCWYDELAGVQVKDVSPYEILITGHPADHPTRKYEPKGPRGRWGKL